MNALQIIGQLMLKVGRLEDTIRRLKCEVKAAEKKASGYYSDYLHEKYNRPSTPTLSNAVPPPVKEKGNGGLASVRSTF